MFASWRVGIVLSAMNMTGPGFAGLIRSTEEADMKVRKLQSSMSMLKLAAAYGMAEVGRVGVSAFMEAANAAGKFQLNMNLLAQQTKANAKELAGFRDISVELSTGSGRTLFSQDQIVDVIRELQQSGISKGNLLKGNGQLVKETSYLAELEYLRDGTNPNTTAKAIGSFIKGYGLDAHPADMNTFANLVSKISSQTHMKIQDLMTLETQFGQTARTFNMTPEGVLGLFGFLKQRGFQTSTAATSLSNMLVNMMPTFSLNATKTAAKTQALMMMNLLEKGDPNNAKKMLQMYEQGSAAVGLPVDPAHMTAKQQEALAQAIVVAVTSGKFGGHGKLDAQKIVTALYDAENKFKKMFGDDTGHQIFASMARQAVNLRGFRALMAIADNKEQYDQYVKDYKQVQDLDVRIGMLRSQYSGQIKTLPHQLATLMTNLGGYTITPGKNPGDPAIITPTAGGPLDLVTKALSKFNYELSTLNQWFTKHPGAAKDLGTLAGVMGVGMLTGAAVLATGAMVNLTRSMLEFSGVSGERGLVGWLGRVFGGAGAAESVLGAGTGREMGLLGRMAGTRAGLARSIADWEHPLNPFFQPRMTSYVRSAGELTEQEYRGLSRFGQMRMMAGRNFRVAMKPTASYFGGMLGESGGEFAKLGAYFMRILGPIARVAGFLGKLAFGFADIVGWVMLAWQAIKFVVDHAFDIGFWAGKLANLVQDAIIPGIGKALSWIAHAFAGMVVNLWHDIVGFVTPSNWVSFFSNLESGWAKARDEQAWAKKQANEHLYLVNEHKKHNASELAGIRHQQVLMRGAGFQDKLHAQDNRKFDIAISVNGMLDSPEAQQRAAQGISENVLDILKKDASMHKWATPSGGGSHGPFQLAEDAGGTW